MTSRPDFLSMDHPGRKSVIDTALDAMEVAMVGMTCSLSSAKYREQSKAAYDAWRIVLETLGEDL